MSDIFSPESATAALTASSACAASGLSAVRVALENPTPLTATLHRLSHIRLLLPPRPRRYADPCPREPSSLLSLGSAHRATGNSRRKRVSHKFENGPCFQRTLN